MDPLSALSAASSVVQLVDFISKIASDSYKLYKSDSGELERTAELKQVTTQLVSLNSGLETSLQTQATKANLSQTNQELRDLCIECNSVAGDLIVALKKLQGRRSSKWSSVILALRTVWSQDDIDILQSRVDGFRQQIALHILVALREQSAFIDERHRRTDDKINQVLFQSQRQNENLVLQSEQSRKWQSEFIKLMRREHALQVDPLDDALQLAKYPFLKTTINEIFTATILRKLYFDRLDDRYERIPEAHERTFRWILHEPDTMKWSSYVKWLEGDDPLYWVTGKAGAGKSTLMKFIHRAPETQKSLQVWGAGKDVVQATFFFWNSGSSMQMSQEGLLRTLLHQILTKYPHLVSQAFPQEFETFLFFRKSEEIPLKWSDLTKAFQGVVKELKNTAKIALFIDGLDEFDGDHVNLVEFIRTLSSPGVKMCVSSRPWTIFEDAFKHEASLKLEDLTFSDINEFVSSKLLSSAGFEALKVLNPDYALGLIKNVTTKSSGVFLWVHLVVKSLLEGLSGGERLSDLQRRLDSLPPDLENLFWKMLNQLEPDAFQHGLQLFQILRSAVRSPTVLELSFADEDTPDYAFNFPIGVLSEAEMTARAEIMRRRLNTCTKGLLEAGLSSKLLELNARKGLHPVQYLHRTVRDFIERKEVWVKLQSSLISPFDANISLFNFCLINLKTHSLVSFEDNFFWEAIREGIDYAIKVDSDSASFQFKALENIDRTATVLFSNYVVHRRASKPLLLTYESKIINSPNSQHWTVIRRELNNCDSLLEFAVKYQLTSYVKAFLTRPPPTFSKEELNQLLYWASSEQGVHYPPHRYLWHHDLPSPELIQLLLANGADPEARVKGKRIRETLCETLNSVCSKEWEIEDQILTILMNHEAKNAVVKGSAMKPKKVIIKKRFDLKRLLGR